MTLQEQEKQAGLKCARKEVEAQEEHQSFLAYQEQLILLEEQNKRRKGMEEMGDATNLLL